MLLLLFATMPVHSHGHAHVGAVVCRAHRPPSLLTMCADRSQRQSSPPGSRSYAYEQMRTVARASTEVKSLLAEHPPLNVKDSKGLLTSVGHTCQIASEIDLDF